MAGTMDCYASFDNNVLTIGNALIERTWRWRERKLLAASWLFKQTRRNWIARESEIPSLRTNEAPICQPAFEARRVTDGPTERESLVVELKLTDRTLRFKIFPESASITLQLLQPGAPLAPQPPGATGVEEPFPETPAAFDDAIDCFAPAPPHLRLTQVTLLDRTDHHENLVHETHWLLLNGERRLGLRGNVFVLEDTLTGDGLIFLKLAPLPHERPIASPLDLQAQPGDLRVLGHGIDPADPTGAGYPMATIAYTGGRFGRIAAIQNYQRQIRPYQPGRDGVFLSNTWGDRNKDGRICDAFIRQEIAAGAQLGVDVVQIDDGWQKGRTANSVKAGGVWNGFWAADPDFWQPHTERFPAGLADLAEAARSHGMRLGLWFAPDSSNDFANWRRDADRLLELHRELGVSNFKLDGIKMHSRTSERNLRRLVDTLLAESHGAIACDLDVTAETRPGYFGLPHAGPAFVENRYTDSRRYWPHATLRNLWMLGHYVDPLRLRMEFLNNSRNADKYPGDPISPSAYRADYLFASVMFASPLGWFETSNLPTNFVQQVSPLVKLWKQHRDEIFAGPIVPIGDEPSGSSWTGFAGPSHVVVLRERHAAATREFDLPAIPRDATVIAGRGEASIVGGKLRVTIPEQLNFVWLSL
jgi:alpha-galactosidase